MVMLLEVDRLMICRTSSTMKFCSHMVPEIKHAKSQSVRHGSDANAERWLVVNWNTIGCIALLYLRINDCTDRAISVQSIGDDEGVEGEDTRIYECRNTRMSETISLSLSLSLSLVSLT
jgi:hypothetical protein